MPMQFWPACVLAQMLRREGMCCTAWLEKSACVAKIEVMPAYNAPRSQVLANCLRLAEGSKKAGSFPPSSMHVGTMISAAARATFRNQLGGWGITDRKLTFFPTGSLPMTMGISCAFLPRVQDSSTDR